MSSSPRRRPSRRRGSATQAQRSRVEGTLLAALAVVLWAWFAVPFAMHGLHVPLGPDGPVYLWWTRLAGHDGLSAVPRPGVPAIALTLEATTRLPLTAVTAGLEIALSVALGLACVALARAGGAGRWTAVVAGLLGGTFAVHLAAGYLATLAFAVGFVGAVVALARPERASLVAAVGMLGAATFAHPLFGPLGVAILVVAGALAWRHARDEVRRVAVAIGGTVVVVGLGLLALLAGPSPLHVDTSRDGFLRRAGLGDILRSAYLDRFVHRWTRYVEWFSVPLAAIGWRSPDGFARRALWAWALVTVAGVAASLATGWFPADRFITFGFAIPVLAAFGLERLWSWLGERRRAVAALASAVLVASMLAGAWIAWDRQEPFISDREIEQVTTANAASVSAPRMTPLVFIVDDTDESLSFLATRAANVIRAGMPPDRIRDVVVAVPPGGPGADAERQALTRLTSADVRTAERTRREPWRFTLTAFDPIGGAAVPTVGPGVVVASDHAVAPRAGGVAVDPLEPAATWQIALASLAQLLLFAVSGYGWARAASFERGITAWSVAPAFGFAAFVLLAIALERAGVPLTGSIGPTVVSALAVGGGFAVVALRERTTGADGADEFAQQPRE